MNNKSNKKLIVLGLKMLVILAFGVVAIIPIGAKAYTPFIIPQDNSNPVPFITSIRPDSISGIRDKITIDINGGGFVPSSVVRKNGYNRPSTFIDSSHILVDIYASDLYNQKEFYLTVFNGPPDGGYSNAALFTIGPTVSSGTAGVSAYGTVGVSSSSNSSSSSTNTVNTSANTSTSNNSNTSNESSSGASDINENYGSLSANALVGSSGFMPTGLVQWIILALIILAIILLWRYLHGEEKYLAEPMKHD